MVVPRGNAPRSPAYQAGALLLSYGATTIFGFAPNRFSGTNVTFNFRIGRNRNRRFGL